ncbi:MAG: ABC transporter ATP-binding protein, partial [Deltaproteobacteria bacterium]|nr:ABC transporter ATP-binding protein [Deltaproteobacteria bacterium]
MFGIKLKPRHRRLLGMVTHHKMRFLVSMLCSALVSVTTAASAWLLQPAIDDVFISKDVSMLKMFPLLIIGLFLLRGIGIYGQEYLMSYVGQNIILRLRNGLYDRIQDLPLSFFQDEKTGVLMSRITNDVNVLKLMVSDSVKAALRDCFSILALTFVIFYRDWQLALIALVVLPLAFLPVVKFGRRVREVSTRSQEAMADMNAFLHETFAGSKIVKAFGMEAVEKRRFGEKVMHLFRLEVKTAMAKGLSPAVMEVFAGLGIAFILYYGGSAVISGETTPGTLVSFIGAVMLLYTPVKKLSRINNIVQEGLAAVDRIFDVMETESNIREADNPITIPTNPHRVQFDNVSFRYEQDDVLKNIHLDVAAGEVLALVGMSGGGKTTLVNLIPRFFDTTRGNIRIDDCDIRNASLKSLRRQIAVVTQEPILFNDTVRNNIAYGNVEATDAEIERAANAAYAYEFVMGFPKGFDTIIGELGGRLSGGEKQRLCIARALVKDAPILILDEATSALDTESEMWVQKALGNLMK